MLRSLPATLMRGGTSKGLYIDARDLPADRLVRDRVLLAAMGSPDVRQIDGVGGAHPLTSKVAVVGPSTRPDADVDYLFLQVVVDKAEVSDSQNCGNILAGVGPWALEHGYVAARDAVTSVRIHMVNTASIAIAHVPTPAGVVEYEGTARIDGVPGTAAAISIDFLDVAGSSCGALLPTGHVVDQVDGVAVTCIDNGMPVVILDAIDFGLSGTELPQELEANALLKARIEKIRLELGPRMNLGDVSRKTVPKMTLVSKAHHGGAVDTRTFIPHRVHEAIGVLGAVSVATACALPGSVAARVAGTRPQDGAQRLDIEHPTGFFTVELDIGRTGSGFQVRRSALVRTARKLMAGELFRTFARVGDYMSFPSIALIGYGEVGQILAANLQAGGANDLVVWDKLFPIAESIPARAIQRNDNGARAAVSMGEAVAGKSLVISAVTAGECIAAAREAATGLAPEAYYFDLNSVSPETKSRAACLVEACGGRYIEAAVMSPISPLGSASPMLIGGRHATGFAEVARSLGFAGVEVHGDTVGGASAAKMCRSVMIKGLEALLTESLLAARHYGVENSVLGSLQNLFPASDWPALARYMISRSLQHGRRRAEEMREVAQTVRDAGIEPWMSAACVERQAWAAVHATAANEPDLVALLDAVRTRVAHDAGVTR